MKIVEIRSETELPGLRPTWNALLQQSASDTIFLTWEWTTSWWSSYGAPGSLRILLAVDDQGTVRGIAPLKAGTISRNYQTFRTVSFLADGSNDSDYLDFIVENGYEASIMQAFFRHLTPQILEGTLLLLSEIPESSPNAPFLQRFGGEPGMLLAEETVPCASVPLPPDWDSYLQSVKPRFRTKIRSVLRTLEERPEVRFGGCEAQSELARLLPALFDLHARRWATEARPGVFGWDQKRDFYNRLTPVLLDRGWLHFTWLAWRERYLACQYGFTYGGRYFQLQEGYEPASEHWSIGLGLRAWSIRKLIGEGVLEYDFLGGIGRHKSDWGSLTKQSKRLVLGRQTGRNWLFCHGPRIVSQIRESVKDVLPERVVAMRAAYLQRSNGANGVSHAAADGGNHRGSAVRAALAGFYVNSPLPAVVGRFRSRYQIEMSGSKRPRITSRQNLPCARILCYHRVNDDGDPFFPATPVKLFEEEMEFIARHYRVAPLSAVLDSLRGGASEGPVLAITLDDGYQDNYTNVLPILQRYRLPATIFLTTDPIDRREAIWFEQLALALKKTAREFIDWELDVPRRFWLRTQEERLRANDEIHGLLRKLPDGDRRQWLDKNLEFLQPRKESDRENKMLTWDQIRMMKSHGVDFGGHTVTHPFMSRTEQQQALWEVAESKRRIEQELQSPVEHFAYPHGHDGDFIPWNKDVLRQAGYEAALTSIWGLNFPGADPLELRRGGPWEKTAALFAAKLDWYQLVNG